MGHNICTVHSVWRVIYASDRNGDCCCGCCTRWVGDCVGHFGGGCFAFTKLFKVASRIECGCAIFADGECTTLGSVNRCANIRRVAVNCANRQVVAVRISVVAQNIIKRHNSVFVSRASVHNSRWAVVGTCHFEGYSCCVSSAIFVGQCVSHSCLCCFTFTKIVEFAVCVKVDIAAVVDGHDATIVASNSHRLAKCTEWISHSGCICAVGDGRDADGVVFRIGIDAFTSFVVNRATI